MKKIIYILIAIAFFSCSTTKLFKEYELYRSDKSINYTKEKLSLKFLSDTTGLFINTNNNGIDFTQRFNFTKVNNDYLIVESIMPINKNIISLKQKDTIILAKRRLLFFYNGTKKYMLSFRKK